jgi:hypothetical protein
MSVGHGGPGRETERQNDKTRFPALRAHLRVITMELVLVSAILALAVIG